MPVQLQDEIILKNKNSFQLNTSESSFVEENNPKINLNYNRFNSNVKTHDLIDYFNSKVFESKSCNESNFNNKDNIENNSIENINKSKSKLSFL